MRCSLLKVLTVAGVCVTMGVADAQECTDDESIHPKNRVYSVDREMFHTWQASRLCASFCRVHTMEEERGIHRTVRRISVAPTSPVQLIMTPALLESFDQAIRQSLCR